MQKRNTFIALSTLAVLSASTFGGLGTQSTEARGFIRRHPFVSAAAAVGGYMVYHHYHKKHMRQRNAYNRYPSNGYSSYRRR